MIPSDFWLCVAFFVCFIISLTSKKLNSVTFLVALACFYASVIYANSSWWDNHNNVVNHFWYAAPFLIGVFFVQKPVKKSLLCYALLQFVAAIESYFYETQTLFYDSYIYLQFVSAVYILCSLFWARREKSSKHSSFSNSWILGLRSHAPYIRKKEL
jgi:hypothetical protein